MRGRRGHPAAATVLGFPRQPAEKMTNVFLVGPMGSGKSAVGRQLARRLGLRFVDSDEEIRARTGVDIPYIFEREGEAGFRLREAEVIDALTREDGVLIATGGGAILDPGSRARVSGSSTAPPPVATSTPGRAVSTSSTSRSRARKPASPSFSKM